MNCGNFKHFRLFFLKIAIALFTLLKFSSKTNPDFAILNDCLINLFATANSANFLLFPFDTRRVNDSFTWSEI